MIKKLRIMEAMGSSIPSWLKSRMSALAKPVYRGRYSSKKSRSDFADKVDVSRTTYHPMPIPRTSQEFNKINKDPNMVTVVHFSDDSRWGDTDKVWLVGFNDDISATFNGMEKPISRHASKNIIPHIIDYGYLELGGPEYDTLKMTRNYNKSDDRRTNAQYIQQSHKPEEDYVFGQGWVSAQGPTMQTWETKPGYDKSGYKITGIEKYKKMLAEIGLSNYEKTMDVIYDTYSELTSLIKLCRGSKTKLSAYNKINRYIVDKLADVEGQYLEYQATMNQEDGEGWSRDYANKYIKPRVKDALKTLQDYCRKANDFIEHITLDDWTDEDYDNFAWRL